MTGLSVHPLPQKPFILHLLAHKPTRNADLLGPYDYLHDTTAQEATTITLALLASQHTSAVCEDTLCLPLAVH